MNKAVKTKTLVNHERINIPQLRTGAYTSYNNCKVVSAMIYHNFHTLIQISNGAIYQVGRDVSMYGDTSPAFRKAYCQISGMTMRELNANIKHFIALDKADRHLDELEDLKDRAAELGMKVIKAPKQKSIVEKREAARAKRIAKSSAPNGIY